MEETRDYQSNENDTVIELIILENGNVSLQNLSEDESDIASKLGKYKHHVTLEGYEDLFNPRLCG